MLMACVDGRPVRSVSELSAVDGTHGQVWVHALSAKLGPTNDEVCRVIDEPDFPEAALRLFSLAANLEVGMNAVEKWIRRRAEQLWYSQGPFIV